MPPLPLDTSPLDAAPTARVIVALSGGLDSSVLLHALASRQDFRSRSLRAVHINHGLQADAQRWVDHCASFCERLGVPLDVVKVDVSPDGNGVEAAARDARHAALQAITAPGDVVAFAHHRDDQAETFLLRALRASGPDGLGAMRPWRRFGERWLWRPLLDTPRAALEQYARAHGLDWIEDPSNRDDTIDRNFLRLQVLPLLAARWPHANAAFATAATHARDAARLLDDEDARVLTTVLHDSATVEVPALCAVDPARRARVLRRWVASLGLPSLPAEGIRRIELELLGSRPDAQAEFAWHGARIRRWRALLRAERATPPLPPEWAARWSGEAPLLLPDGGSLALAPRDTFEQPVEVRARRGGERIHLAGRAHTHSLKHVLQDRDVPPWEREHLPLLVGSDGDILAAGDVAFSANFSEWLASTGTRLTWRRPPGVAER